MYDPHSNFGYSTVAVAPSPVTSGTTLTVASGQGGRFSPGQNATIWPAGTIPVSSTAEIVRIIGVTGDVLTLRRAQESSSARSVTVGDSIANTASTKTFTDIEGAANGPTKVFERGISLSGLEFSPTTLPGAEGTNYFQPAAADFSYFSKKGFTLARLAVLWERLQPTVGSALDATYKGYIDTAIANAKANGMRIVLEIHNFGARDVSGVSHTIGDGTLSTAHFADLWSKLATAYVNEPTVFAYDLMNEWHDMTTPTTPSNYLTTSTVTVASQAAIDAIRLVDKKKWLLYEIDNFAGMQNFTTLYGSSPIPWWNDPSNRTMLSAHYYQDSDHSGTYVTAWSVTLRNNIISDVTPMLNWGLANEVPIFVGEYGVPNGTGSDAVNWQTDMGTFLGLLDSYGAYGTHWAAGAFYSSATTLQPTSTYTVDREQLAVLQAHLGFGPFSNLRTFGYPVTMSTTNKLQFNGIDRFIGYDITEAGIFIANQASSNGRVKISYSGLAAGSYFDLDLYGTGSVIRADGSRNVGIRNTNPANTLDVAGAFRSRPIALTDAATIATDASLGNEFTVTIAASRTMGAPTNPQDGQSLTYRIKQGGVGSFTITWNAAFRFPGGTAPTLTTTAAKTDYIEFVYNATDSVWDMVNSKLNF